jgi:hypothetical protein
MYPNKILAFYFEAILYIMRDCALTLKELM